LLSAAISGTDDRSPPALSIDMKTRAKSLIRSVVPFNLRIRVAAWLHGQTWICHERRKWWTAELVRDGVGTDVNEYHKFLWKNHLDYAAPYEVASRFGAANVRASRRLFFSHLLQQVKAMGVEPYKIRSIYEVGCSLGYQLHYMETDLFPAAEILEGIDIDAYAIRSGEEYLRSIGSKVRLTCGDMEQLGNLLQDRQFDIMVCTGVLMYLKEPEAARLVCTMLGNTRLLVAFAGLAHPHSDNASLASSEVRIRTDMGR
jgi:SAM-dependent methyltransferase